MKPARTLDRSLIILALCLILPAAASAQVGLYLQITDGNGQDIEGEVSSSSYEGAIEVLAFSHQVVIPIDVNGQPSGSAQTSPLTITTFLDRATVPLQYAQAMNQIFDSFVMDLLETQQNGVTIPTFRYTLQDARLVTMNESGNLGGSQVSYSFTYSQIRIEDLEFGSQVVYSWNPMPASTEEQTADDGLLLSSQPNPTHGQTEFRFSLPADSDATLTLYDLRGHAVRELHRGWTKSGGDVAVWDGTDAVGRDVAQGVYLVRLRTPERETTQRITLLR